MKIQELDEPLGAPARPETPCLDHRVVVALEAAAPIWQRARSGEHPIASPLPLPIPRKEPT